MPTSSVTRIRAGFLYTFGLVLLLVAAPSAADDTAVGTFTVKGRTTRLVHVAGTRAVDPADDSRAWVVLLLSDTAVAEPDRTPERLAERAREGSLRAVRVSWTIGSDRLVVTPYHRDVGQSGLAVQGAAILDLGVFDDRSITGSVKSKMLGQDWHFNVRFEAALAPGAPTMLEAVDAVEVETRAGPADATDPTARKIALGRLGYQYDAESFGRAVGDGNAEAVDQFLALGMSPDTVGQNGYAVLSFATMQCGNGDAQARVAVVKALLAAKATVDVKDDNDSTPLLWAAQHCPLEAVEALIAAGADVNAKAKGGGTPLMMAEVLQRTDIAEALTRAGAKPQR